MTIATRVTSRFPKITLLIALPIYCLLFPIPFCFLRDDTCDWTSVYRSITTWNIFSGVTAAALELVKVSSIVMKLGLS